ncbi:MAG: hypothetical protein ACOX6D_06360 [Thermoguttaceae bacterium]|jgi:hypothetical protein
MRGNPNFAIFAPKWQFAHDAYEGTEAIKQGERSLEYLPMTKQEVAEARALGRSRHYEIRRASASYENFFRPIINDVAGFMQKNPPTVKFGTVSDSESPPEVRNIRWYGNRSNDGLAGLKHRLNFAQVLEGRYGLLLDILCGPDGANGQFSISEYPAPAILDGETTLFSPERPNTPEWILLDESARGFDRTRKEWELKSRYRVLGLDANGEFYQAVLDDEPETRWLDFDLRRPPRGSTRYPMFRGRRLPFIPFTVCNVNHLGFDAWEDPPYLDVAHLAVANYQIDSFYKTALQNHASPTLVVANADRPDPNIALGGVIWPTSRGGLPITASLLETSGRGLAELRAAKDFTKGALRYTSVRDLLEGAGANSSAEAIKLRTSTGTAAVAAIDRTGARAIEEQLVFAGIWAGATRTEAMDRITFEADTSYVVTELQLQTVSQFIAQNEKYRILSREALYRLLNKSLPGVLPTYEDNTKQLEAEQGYGEPMPE